MKTIRISCPAKINHTLSIGDVQENSLHAITTEMQKIALSDEIIIEISEDLSPPKISFTLVNPERFEVPEDETNLAYRAAKSFFGNIPDMHIKITLIKNIPSGAGLGGGSSDAAGVLLGLSQIFPENNVDIIKKGVFLGSDVSFFLQNANRATVSGTGEEIMPFPNLVPSPIVLIKQKNITIPTSWAYRQWDKKGQEVEKGNDFESIIFSEYPEIQETIKVFKKLGANEARLSGSGSAVYALFSDVMVSDYAMNYFDSETYWKWKGETL